MAQTTPVQRPQLVAPRVMETLDAVRSLGVAFDADVWHIMNQRDDQLAADSILHGAMSSAFLYRFDIKGTPVVGISVIGARHLASVYRGLKFRLVAEQHKIGARLTMTQFPGDGLGMMTDSQTRAEYADDADYYLILAELIDIKTGNSIQGMRRESRFERDRHGNEYERPNYPAIAQSKVYRNLVLNIIPQDVRLRWQEEMLKLGKSVTITDSVIDEKRRQVLHFAAQRAIALDRRAVESLTLDQIAGLGDAAREGRLPAFVNAAQALGLDVAAGTDETDSARAGEGARTAPAAPPGSRRRARGPSGPEPAAAPSGPADSKADPGSEAVPEEPGDAAPSRQVRFEV